MNKTYYAEVDYAPGASQYQLRHLVSGVTLDEAVSLATPYAIVRVYHYVTGKRSPYLAQETIAHIFGKKASMFADAELYVNPMSRLA